MRTLLALAVLLSLGIVSEAWAWDCPQAVSATTINRCTTIVFNDNGSNITSGQLVVWDQDDTDFSTTLYPYVTTTTTADDPYTAGIMLTDTCANQSLCEIVVWGPTYALIADSTDDATVDTLVGSSTVAGQMGDYGTAANACAVGTFVRQSGAATYDGSSGIVFVDVDCD